MVCLTKAQRDALFRLFQRDFPSWVTPSRQNSITREEKLSDTGRGLPSRFQAVWRPLRFRLAQAMRPSVRGRFLILRW